MTRMTRYEHCMVEWYWSAPSDARVTFRPQFVLFFGDGRRETHDGGSAEIATLFGRMGAEGWRVTTSTNAANWVLWTLERVAA
ncbi:MAG: hypothetical protein KIT84_01250 [Labilithrix sp.]|nr:hypothetical protein [Labilithrix sp.]MCW5809612.1 hypothetical protein [Labilithrix sp.]